jgi:hypothetical protein
MLLQCEICNAKVSQLMKVPCGFYLEISSSNVLTFVMPLDETAYRNLCLDCLFQNLEGEK